MSREELVKHIRPLAGQMKEVELDKLLYKLVGRDDWVELEQVLDRPSQVIECKWKLSETSKEAEAKSGNSDDTPGTENPNKGDDKPGGSESETENPGLSDNPNKGDDKPGDGKENPGLSDDEPETPANSVNY